MLMRDRVEIIAEVGVNHNGKIDLAKELIDAAVDSGADTVKFQCFSAEEIATKISGKAPYQSRATQGDESQQEMLRQYEFNPDQWLELRRYCDSRNIKFLSTAFDISSIDFLSTLGQDRFKVPSGEINNFPYLKHIGRYRYPVLLSTGMSSMEEVGDAIQILEGQGVKRDQITVLHCTSQYPAPMLGVNLLAMQAIKASFGVRVGYSDHTQGVEVSVAAVALGAKVIEKHLTLNQCMNGPDHKASLEPEGFRSMVTAIRNTEVALGDGIKRLMECEVENLIAARKSIVARKTIHRGEKFSENNLCVKRPGSGVSPNRWDEVIGSVALKQFEADELIEL